MTFNESSNSRWNMPLLVVNFSGNPCTLMKIFSFLLLLFSLTSTSFGAPLSNEILQAQDLSATRSTAHVIFFPNIFLFISIRSFSFHFLFISFRNSLFQLNFTWQRSSNPSCRLNKEGQQRNAASSVMCLFSCFSKMRGIPCKLLLKVSMGRLTAIIVPPANEFQRVLAWEEVHDCFGSVGLASWMW